MMLLSGVVGWMVTDNAQELAFVKFYEKMPEVCFASAVQVQLSEEARAENEGRNRQ